MSDAPGKSTEAAAGRGMTVPEILAREVSSGFDRLRGTAIAGHVPIAQSVINDLLALSGGPLSRASVEVQSGNALVIRYRSLISVPVTVVLDEAVDLPRTGPRVTLTIRSALIAGLLSMKRMPFVEMSGKRMTIDVGRIAHSDPSRCRLETCRADQADDVPIHAVRRFPRPRRCRLSAAGESRRGEPMKEWIQSQIASGLSAFPRGSRCRDRCRSRKN